MGKVLNARSIHWAENDIAKDFAAAFECAKGGVGVGCLRVGDDGLKECKKLFDYWIGCLGDRV
jgi:hypothetical protein